MSECVHCDINELVQQALEGGQTDLPEIASMIAESLVDVVLLAPEADQASLLAHTISAVAHIFLEKTGTLEGGPQATHSGVLPDTQPSGVRSSTPAEGLVERSFILRMPEPDCEHRRSDYEEADAERYGNRTGVVESTGVAHQAHQAAMPTAISATAASPAKRRRRGDI